MCCLYGTKYFYRPLSGNLFFVQQIVQETSHGNGDVQIQIRDIVMTHYYAHILLVHIGATLTHFP